MLQQRVLRPPPRRRDGADAAAHQGLTLVHFSTQRKRFLWDRGSIEGLFRGCLVALRGYSGVFRVYFVLERAQVEPKSGRV